MTQLMNVEQVVQEWYAAGAKQAESALCCPVTYDSRYLAGLPQEIIDKDYGCGDPSPYLSPGETVLDLGCGAGKICYIVAQIVGPTGRVIGVDMTPDMLALAEKYREQRRS
ncbi:MAG TPA: methyltransferase domain-containing protein [Candidatus Binatia bacterium]|nr:methyltransferase domain-containing protein [Candidatus Binatia bacterium]